MCIPIVDWDDVPLVPKLAVDVSRRTTTNLEKAGEKDIGDAWCGGEHDVRELSDFWVGATVFDKLRNPPPG